jgi:hypothetical protein
MAKMKEFLENIKIWQVILGLLVTIGGIAWGFDQRKANQKDFIALSNQYYIGAAAQKRDLDQKAVYDLENAYRCGPRYGNSCYNIIKDKGACQAYQKLQKNLQESQENLIETKKK